MIEIKEAPSYFLEWIMYAVTKHLQLSAWRWVISDAQHRWYLSSLSETWPDVMATFLTIKNDIYSAIALPTDSPPGI